MANDVDDVPNPVDWSNPAHIPHMVSDVAFACGFEATETWSDDDCRAFAVAALDAMPRGQAAVVRAVRDALFVWAKPRGYRLEQPTPGCYPWVPSRLAGSP